MLVEDARVLQEEFIPSEIAHRDAETSHLSNVLEPITRGDSAEPALLHGPSGAGKTCVAQFTADQLREQVIDINTTLTNCWEDHSRFKCLYRVLDGVQSTVDIHRKSTPTDELLERLRDYEGPRYLVILDEVDQLEDKSLLYDLHRIRTIDLVMIANSDDELFLDMDDRVRSRLSTCERINFEPYRLNELVTILRDRVRWGLADGAINDEAFEKIADEASGDARKAIGILRNAARAAQRDSLETITVDTVEAVIPETESRMRQADLDRLNTDQRALYDIIRETGEIGPGELYEAYQEQVEDPKSKRMVRNYLAKMQHYNLIDTEGQTRSRKYHLVS